MSDNHTYGPLPVPGQPGAVPPGVVTGTVNMGIVKRAYKVPETGHVYALDPGDGTWHMCSPKLDAPSFRPDSEG
jgi:hypothetical protein